MVDNNKIMDAYLDRLEWIKLYNRYYHLVLKSWKVFEALAYFCGWLGTDGICFSSH